MWKSPGSAQARISHQGAFFEEWVGEASDAPADGSAVCRRMHYWGRVLGLENFPIPTSTQQETGWTLLQTTQDERTVSTEMPSSECGSRLPPVAGSDPAGCGSCEFPTSTL